MSEEPTYTITFMTGTKKVEREEWCRLIMPRTRWWEFRYRRERQQLADLAASYGMTLYEE